MKKMLIAAAVTFAAASPAAAAVITVEFTTDEGEAQVWSFDQAAGKATTPDGSTLDYTYDEAARKLCALTSDGELCAVFTGDETEMKAGATARFETSDGATGSATVLSVAE